ncbi:MAG: hypothetical protein RCG15_05385 [Candidatus Rickettsia vulgarisii]
MTKKHTDTNIQNLINNAVPLELNAKNFDDYIEENCLTTVYEEIDKTPIIKLLLEEANLYNTWPSYRYNV